MLKSKLSNNYPIAEPSKYLTGSDYSQIDPIFAGRLAYVAKITGTKIKLTEGYRSTEYQQQLYEQYLEYKRTGKGSIKLAAKPGTSWHEFRLAVDTSTYPIRGMSNEQLKQYGLCKPVKSEGWHIQPIETLNEKSRTKYEPTEVEEMTEQQIRDLINKVIDERIYNKEENCSDWAKPAWENAKENGITDGSSPKAVVTREQCIAMIYRAIQHKMGEA